MLFRGEYMLDCVAVLLIGLTHCYILFPGYGPSIPFSTRCLNSKTMKDTFRSYVELLITVALDAEVMDALERENGGYFVA